MKDNNPAAKIYFPGLNGLRFFAAFAVIITHIELLKGQMNLPNHWQNPVIFNLGGLGVYFFFVLSGFLITYLLLAEKELTGTLSVKNFYIRRILRIWPLYYLIVLLAFFVFPHFDVLHLTWLQRYFEEGFWFKFWLYIFMLPNLALAMYPAVPHAGQVWSIGVEEQFYILWPWLVKYCKRFLMKLLLIFAAIFAVKTGLLIIAHFFPDLYFVKVVKGFVAMSKIECMAIGAAGAYFLFTRNERVLSVIYHKIVQVMAFLLIPVLIYFTPEKLQDGIHIVYSFLFIVIILNVAANPGSILRLESRIFNFLGNISYGLYMYHMVIIVFVVRTLHARWSDIGEVKINILYYSISILCTLAVSWLSFRYFETWFSRKRKNYTKIISGTDTKKEG